jgi:DNA-binding transcriptional LysR family regulator
MPRLRGLIEKHPELEVRLAAGTDYPHFRNDEIDIDICYGPPRQEGMAVLPSRSAFVGMPGSRQTVFRHQVREGFASIAASWRLPPPWTVWASLSALDQREF